MAIGLSKILFIICFSQMICKLKAETCSSSLTSNNTLTTEVNCTQDSLIYCCGDCDNKYCCNDTSMTFDQNQCQQIQNQPDTTPTQGNGNETCGVYKINFEGTVLSIPEIFCNSGYCCGNCDNRYCCDEESSSLDQSLCVDISICLAYSDMNFNYEKAKICGNDPIKGRYCCGECQDRYCCDEPASLLDQEACRYVVTTEIYDEQYNMHSTESPKKNGNESLVFTLIGIGIFLGCLIVFGVPAGVIVYNYRRRIKTLIRRNPNLEMTNLGASSEPNANALDKPPSYKDLAKSESEPPSYKDLEKSEPEPPYLPAGKSTTTSLE